MKKFSLKRVLSFVAMHQKWFLLGFFIVALILPQLIKSDYVKIY